MRALFQEAILILVILGAAVTTPPTPKPPTDTNIVTTSDQSADYQYEDYNYDDDHEEVLFSEDKPCPRDCICKTSLASRIARCSRLEVGTQKFGDDITGLVVENIDKKHPLVLTDMMFRKLGLHQITSVKIINSVIMSINPTAFKGLHELYEMNLTRNGIEVIHPDTFSHNSKLSLVDLSDNPLVIDPESSGEPFIISSSIQELEMTRCGIKSIPKTAFSKLPNLMFINLSGNKLRELDSSVFASLKSLEEVDLSDNFLKEIPEDLFINNSEITTLRLRGNPINTVIGIKINELLTIDLSMAKIKTIGPSMFNGMPYVSNLNLSGNGIRKIHNQAFHQLTSLNYLDLSSNNLDFISDQLIKENIQLDIFKIAKNPFLKNLPEEGFACASVQFNIYLFDASHCSLEKISNNTFKTMPALSQIVLSHNRITSIGSSLQKSPGLVEIDLSHNLLSALDKDAFIKNKDLGKLNLAGNPLTTLSANLFINNPILTWLDISSCRLNSLWENRELSPGNVMSNLHFINISNNNITSLHIKELQTIDKLFTLDISQNPLECSEDLQTLMVWLGDHKVSPAAVDLLSSNTEMSAKVDANSKWEYLTKVLDAHSKWEYLAKTVCGSANFSKVSTQHSSADEKAAVDENILKEIEEHPMVEAIPNGEDYDDDEEDDYDNPLFEDSEIPKIKVTIKNDLPDIYEKIDHNKIDIPMIHDIFEKSEKTEKIINNLEDEHVEGEWVATYIERDDINYYRQYLLPMTITLLIILIIIVALVKLIRHFSNARNSKGFRCAVISITSSNNSGRVKKDCGLVYQQLSEDLSGPKTPIVSRQLLGGNQLTMPTNISYQSSPFHHTNITPEHV